jgi:hypothetical protein
LRGEIFWKIDKIFAFYCGENLDYGPLSGKDYNPISDDGHLENQEVVGSII